MARENVPILVVGDSGSGKSSTIGQLIDDEGKIVHQGLPPKETLIVNIEDKEAPIINAKDFTQLTVYNVKELFNIMQILMQMKGLTPEQEQQVRQQYQGRKCPLDFKYVVFDSLTAVTSIVQKYADTFRGYDVWREYNNKIAYFIEQIKQLPQQVIVMAIPETKDSALGDTKQYVKVKGNELKYGYAESQFTIVLFTRPIYDEQTGEVIDVIMQFRPNKNNTAKSPVGMFKAPLPNDAKVIIEQMRAYYDKN